LWTARPAFGFTVAAGRVVELDLITDPGHLDCVAGSLVDA
jgi:hypothetical protein